MTMPTEKLATMLSAVVRSVMIHIGTTGSAARSSTSTKTTVPMIAPPTMTADCQETQAKLVSTKESHSSRSVTESTMSAEDRKSTRLNSSHVAISYAVFSLKKKNNRKYD